MLNFKELIMQVLGEDNVAGGASSAFGPGVQATANPNQMSGDTYAPGDARRPTSIFGGILSRFGKKGKKKKRTKKRRKKK
jgi:hypothetical protein